MTFKSKAAERIFTTAFNLVVTFLFISGVALAYLTTREKILDNEAMFLKRAILEAAGKEVPKASDVLRKTYDSLVTEEALPDGGRCFRVKDAASGESDGFVIVTTTPGLWGTITAAVGIARQGGEAAITGLAIIDQNETPGLGGRITEDWFLSQFQGKFGPFRMVPEGTNSAEKNEFDAITGATITSTAMLTLLNNTCDRAGALWSAGPTSQPDNPGATEAP